MWSNLHSARLHPLLPASISSQWWKHQSFFSVRSSSRWALFRIGRRLFESSSSLSRLSCRFSRLSMFLLFLRSSLVSRLSLSSDVDFKGFVPMRVIRHVWFCYQRGFKFFRMLCSFSGRSLFCFQNFFLILRQFVKRMCNISKSRYVFSVVRSPSEIRVFPSLFISNIIAIRSSRR